MRMTEAQLRSTIRKMLLEFTPALKADAEWADLTDGSGPMQGLMSGKTIPQAIKDLYGHLLDLEPGELEDQYPELDASIIASGDEDAALDHLRVVVTAVHAENEKDYDRDAVRQDLMYFATKSKRPELKVLQQRVLDPKQPEYTITSLAYEEDLKAVLGKIEDEVASLSDEEAKRIRNILAAEEDDDKGFARPRPQTDFKSDPDAATVPGVKQEGTNMKVTPAQLKSLIEAEIQEKKKKKKTDFDPGGQAQYRANRTQKQIKKQSDLTRQYNAAKTEPQKQKIRIKIDKSREKEGVAETASLTKHHLKELISEVVEAEKLAIILEKVEELEEKKKRKKRKKKKSGKSSKGLSAAVKKSLDKKADRRGLTRGSVYAEFRKGLAAYYSSGSRKGMSAHQWAHARVNSANPSKSWAVVKKSKAKKKKKKK